jgi:hypothetical protein
VVILLPATHAAKVPDVTLRGAVCRLQVLRLDAIVGTLEPTTAFDARVNGTCAEPTVVLQRAT